MLSTLSSNIAIAQVTVLPDLLQIVCAVALYRLSRMVDANLALFAMPFVSAKEPLELMKMATASNPF